MLDWHDARELAHAAGHDADSSSERVALADAVGRTLATPVASLVSLPGHSSSAMDGWVVSGEPPWSLGESISAGDPASTPLDPGTARGIATGAIVPEGTAGVLRLEHGLAAGASLARNEHSRLDEPRLGEHVRATGEEVRAGEPLLDSGIVLTPVRVAMLAACGHDEVDVTVAPNVDVVSFGYELVASGLPAAGRVRDVFAPSIGSMIRAMGGFPSAQSSASDTLDAAVAAITSSHAPLLITTGGTSRGATDHVRAALTAVGATILIDGVNMRPGHPVILARREAQLVLCLPGNPLAALVGLATLGAPLVAGLLGRAIPRLGSVTLGLDVANGSPIRLVPVSLTPAAIPTRHVGSAMLRGLAESDAVAVIPPGGALAGSIVETLPMPWAYAETSLTSSPAAT